MEKNKEMLQDLSYVLDNYEEDVMLYLKHTIGDCQQEKAKRDMLENFGDNDIFWIKGRFWSKKNESACYVVYMKKDNNLHKYVYFTLYFSTVFLRIISHCPSFFF